MAVALQICVSVPEAYSVQNIDNSAQIPANEVQFKKITAKKKKKIVVSMKTIQ